VLDKPVETLNTRERFLATAAHVAGGTALWAVIHFPVDPAKLLPEQLSLAAVVFIAALILFNTKFRWWSIAAVVCPVTYSYYCRASFTAPIITLLIGAHLFSLVFSVLFARHWVCLRTAYPCDLATASQIRSNLDLWLIVLAVLSPLILPVALILVLAEFPEGMRAVSSWLTYNRAGVTGLGVHKSGAGPWPLRLAVFYVAFLLAGPVCLVLALVTVSPFLRRCRHAAALV
jgi:hypothetical protein